MTTDQMREAIRKAYSGQAWQYKVDVMSDAQVIAVWRRLHNQGKI